jgi:hypothetical protein
VRQVAKTFAPSQETNTRRNMTGQDFMPGWEGVPRGANRTETLGWAPSCKCKAGAVPARILDPFGGSGTTGLVADRLGRDATLIDLNTEYVSMAVERLRADCPLFAEVAAE